MEHLSFNDLEILKDLLRMRNATPAQFAIETCRVGEDFLKKFNALESDGWLKSVVIDDGLEPKVFYVTAKTLAVLRGVSVERVA